MIEDKDLKLIKSLSEPYYAFIRRETIESINKDLVTRLLESGEIIDSPPNVIISRKLYDKIKEV
jgi:hypothetical protein